MPLQYNPATNKLLRTSTPKLASECPTPVLSCSDYEAHVTVSGVGNLSCGGDCANFNTTFVLDPGQGCSGLLLSGCLAFVDTDNADCICCWGLDNFALGSQCGPYDWQLAIYGYEGVNGPGGSPGWSAVLGFGDCFTNLCDTITWLKDSNGSGICHEWTGGTFTINDECTTGDDINCDWDILDPLNPVYQVQVSLVQI